MTETDAAEGTRSVIAGPDPQPARPRVRAAQPHRAVAAPPLTGGG